MSNLKVGDKIAVVISANTISTIILAVSTLLCIKAHIPQGHGACWRAALKFMPLSASMPWCLVMIIRACPSSVQLPQTSRIRLHDVHVCQLLHLDAIAPPASYPFCLASLCNTHRIDRHDSLQQMHDVLPLPTSRFKQFAKICCR